MKKYLADIIATSPVKSTPCNMKWISFNDKKPEKGQLIIILDDGKVFAHYFCAHESEYYPCVKWIPWPEE